MPKTDDEIRMEELIRSRLLTDPAQKERTLALNAAFTSHRNDMVAKIAKELLGVRPEHGDTIYTQHPLMAGVLRRALERAFEDGSNAAAMVIMLGPDGLPKRG